MHNPSAAGVQLLAYKKKRTITKGGEFVKYQPSAFCHDFFFFLLPTKTSDNMKLHSFSEDALKTQDLSILDRHKGTVVSQIKPVLAWGQLAEVRPWEGKCY